MLSKIKRLTKQTLIYGVGTILTRFVTFMLLPVYTNVLSPADYGLAVLIFVFLAFMNYVYNYGLDSALLRFYSEASNRQVKSRILSTAVWMALATSAALSLIIYLLHTPLAHFLIPEQQGAIYFKYAALILFFDCLCRVPFALLRLKERPYAFMGIRLINVAMTLGLNIYFVVILKMGVIGIFRSNLITSATTATLLYVIMVKELSFTFSGHLSKDMLLFGLPFVPTGLATAAMEMINRYIVKHFLGLDQVGIFSAGYKLGIFMLLVSTAFYYAWQPFFLKAGPSENSRYLFGRILTYFSAVALSFWVLLTLFMPEIVNLHIRDIYLIGPEFQSCVTIVPFVLLGYVFYGINQVFLPGIYFKKKTRYLAANTVLAALVNVGANYFLVPRLGIVGSALASLTGYICLATATYLVSQRLFKIYYEYGRLLVLFGVSLIAGFSGYFLSLSWYVRLIIVISLPLLLRLLGFFKPEELSGLLQIFKNRLKITSDNADQ